MDINIEAFKIGDNVRVISKPHGLDRYFLLSKLSLALDSVSSCSMTLGATFKTFTQKQIESEKLLNATVKNTSSNTENLSKSIKNIQNNVEKLDESINKTDKKVNNLDENVQEINNNLIQVPANYVKTSEFEFYKKDINQKLYGIYTVKGSLTSLETLETIQDVQVGDVYNILDTGANYVYTVNGWDKLSETIDFSIYLKNEDAKLTYVPLDEYQNLVSRVEKLERKNNENGEGGTT